MQNLNLSLSSNTNLTATEDYFSGRFLLFYIEETLYGLPLRHVLEIIKTQHITRIPKVPHHIKGIINLRGKVVPVMDIRLKFNLDERPYDDKTCIIIVEIHGMQIGLIVDCVSEVVSAEESQLSDPPEFGDSNSQYLSSVMERGDEVILNLDCARFFQQDIPSEVH